MWDHMGGWFCEGPGRVGLGRVGGCCGVLWVVDLRRVLGVVGVGASMDVWCSWGLMGSCVLGGWWVLRGSVGVGMSCGWGFL